MTRLSEELLRDPPAVLAMAQEQWPGLAWYVKFSAAPEGPWAQVTLAADLDRVGAVHLEFWEAVHDAGGVSARAVIAVPDPTNASQTIYLMGAPAVKGRFETLIPRIREGMHATYARVQGCMAQVCVLEEQAAGRKEEP